MAVEPRENRTAATVGRNVARLRAAKGMSARALSAKLEELGHPLAQSGVSDLENGKRSVSVDQLTCLAVALGSSPLELLAPPSGQNGEPVYGGLDETDPEKLLAWLHGGITKDALSDLGLSPGTTLAEVAERLRRKP